jgi:hypothetical protein
MELASRIFDVVTSSQNIFHDTVRAIVPDEEGRRYWKSVLRMAALCHDLGHLPLACPLSKLVGRLSETKPVLCPPICSASWAVPAQSHSRRELLLHHHLSERRSCLLADAAHRNSALSP